MEEDRLTYTRLDQIQSVRPGAPVQQPEAIQQRWEAFRRGQWGVSSGGEKADKVSMVICVGPGEAFIVQRLEREKRIGTVTQIDDQHWKYEAEVWNAEELLPWVRTFIGRIEAFDCTNQAVMTRYREDLRRMAELYGGDGDAVQ